MNKIVASISLGTAVCITASAFAQDSHLSPDQAERCQHA